MKYFPKKKRPLFPFKTFPRYEEVQNYMRLMQEIHGDFVRVETIGKSFEGRNIDMIILKKFNCRKAKCSTFIDATIHAREWISITTALYFIQTIIHNPKYLNSMNYFVVPCINPDGYEFTHTKQRLWRKNRNPNFRSDLDGQGVDLNRNFACGYGLEGSSDDPTSYKYRGKCPLSEPESQAIADALLKYQREIRLYISIHSFGNLIMFPWGFSTTHVPDRKDLEACGRAGQRAIANSSQKCRHLKVGSVARKMELCSGTSMDYAKACLNIKFAFTVELQPYGKSGFTPCFKNVDEIGSETTKGLFAMANYVQKYYRGKEQREPRRR